MRLATTMLHIILLRAGIYIHEYIERPLHAKVAVIDNEWSTVGSSNVDPLSLYLNLESNLTIRAAGFAVALTDDLKNLIR